MRLRHWTTEHNSSRTRPAKVSRTKVKLNKKMSILRNPSRGFVERKRGS